MNLRTAIGSVCSAIVLCVGVQAVCAAPPPQVSWAAQAGGTTGDEANAISALPDGSSVVTGYFTDTATFGSTTLTSTGDWDVFTAKANADGTWAWATQAGGPGYDEGNAVSTLPDGSSIVTGQFEDTATFGSTTLTSSAGSYDVFTAKMNADGTWAWATQAGGPGYEEGYGVSALPDGSSIVTGQFKDTATFGSTTLTSAGSWDVFTAKVNADGTWAWATKAGGLGDDDGFAISGLPDGSSIVTGQFEDIATFGGSTLTSTGSWDVFTAKMNADGTWAWATQAGGSGDDEGWGISALPDGSSIVTGVFSDTATFGSTTLTSTGEWDVFTAKMNADGTWAWATGAGGTGEDEGNGVSALPDGSAFVAGEFSGPATFGGTTLAGSGGTCGTAPNTYTCSDVFTARYLDAPQAPAAPVAVAGNASAAVTLTPLAGGSVTSYTVTSDPGEKTCTVVAPKTSCTVEGLTNGTSYRFRATATNAMGTGAASAWSSPVTPAAAAVAAAAVIKGKVHCVATTCVTTGSVPAGATRITQRATSRPSGHSATGKCTIRRTKAKRTYSCTVHLSRGTWVITTTARTQSAAMAHFSKRVQVAPRKAAVTG